MHQCCRSKEESYRLDIVNSAALSEHVLLPCSVYFHFSDGNNETVIRSRTEEGNLGKAERVDRKPEEFVISAEDLTNPFSVFGKPKMSATAANAGAPPKTVEEERTNNK